jgi:DNA-directed RNA polymerase specialized sigma subunit
MRAMARLPKNANAPTHSRGSNMNSGKYATFIPRALNADLDPTLMQHKPLVSCLAHQMIAKLAANVEIDDLINVGMIGLADALARFDAAQDVQFENFATTRTAA